MSAETTEGHPPTLTELRAEVERLRAELSTLRSNGGAQQLATGDPVVAGQYNTADAPTVLECTKPTLTLGLVNHTPGTPSTGTAIGLYTLARGIGAMISAYGSAPAPVISKAVQAYCEQGPAVFADSRSSEAVYAHTSFGSAAIVADQGSQNPRGVAVNALGGNGVGVYASGATAALQIGRSQLPGAPASGSHEAGEVVLDANADLYLCKQSGTPGTWKLIG